MFLENTKVFKWKSLFLLNSFQNEETIFEKEINGFQGDDFNFKKQRSLGYIWLLFLKAVLENSFLCFQKKKKKIVFGN